MTIKVTPYGFKYGAAEFNRLCNDKKKGWTVTGLTTQRYRGHDIQIYVTRTGKVRIHDDKGEWKRPK